MGRGELLERGRVEALLLVVAGHDEREAGAVGRWHERFAQSLSHVKRAARIEALAALIQDLCSAAWPSMMAGLLGTLGWVCR